MDVTELADAEIRGLSGSELDDAITDLTVAVFRSPPGDSWMEGKSRIRRKLVLAYAIKEDYTSLEPIAREVLKYAKTDAEMHYFIGVAVQRRGEPGIAAESFERAIECKPDYQEAIDALESLNQANLSDTLAPQAEEWPSIGGKGGRHRMNGSLKK